jgi:hypothetical protein
MGHKMSVAKVGLPVTIEAFCNSDMSGSSTLGTTGRRL